MHETFCFWSFSEWRRRVEAEGFVVDERSRGIVNQWLVAERFVAGRDLEASGSD